MKLITLILTCFLLVPGIKAQYYYKDQIVLRQTIDQLLKYREQKVRSVKLISYENDGRPSEGFEGEQAISNNYLEVSTIIKSPITGGSELRTFYNSKGQLIKTTDTTDGSGSISNYTYNEKGLLDKITNLSTSAGLAKEKEVHQWIYNEAGKPLKMVRIKNDSDTTFVNFVLDESGNVTEENSERNRIELPSVYYYYESANRLTDIASYSKKANRILPEYVFEYNEKGQLSAMLVVPEGSSEYQKWYYEYNEAGLKTRDNCFNKRRQLLGKIEYQYQ